MTVNTRWITHNFGIHPDSYLINSCMVSFIDGSQSHRVLHIPIQESERARSLFSFVALGSLDLSTSLRRCAKISYVSLRWPLRMWRWCPDISQTMRTRFEKSRSTDVRLLSSLHRRLWHERLKSSRKLWHHERRVMGMDIVLLMLMLMLRCHWEHRLQVPNHRLPSCTFTQSNGCGGYGIWWNGGWTYRWTCTAKMPCHLHRHPGYVLWHKLRSRCTESEFLRCRTLRSFIFETRTADGMDNKTMGSISVNGKLRSWMGGTRRRIVPCSWMLMPRLLFWRNVVNRQSSRLKTHTLVTRGCRIASLPPLQPQT